MAVMCVPLLAPAPARATDDAVDAAIFLLQKATAVNRSGTHHRLLKALRHLEDPALGPLFADLSQRDRPSLRVHGVLGLAEISRGRKLDLGHLLEVEPPALQAELISSALDADLMSLDDCERILQWQGIDLGVKLVLATRLVEAGRFEDIELLRESLQNESPGRRAMAAALLVQLGKAAGLSELESLSSSDLPRRDLIEQTIFQMCVRHELDRLSGWALRVARKPDASFKRRLGAVRVALRFGEPGAGELWTQWYEASDNLVERMQLGMALLEVSAWVSPELFEPMMSSGTALLSQMGKAGRAVAADDPRAVDMIYELVLMRHALTNRWAAFHATQRARPNEGQVILLGMIQAAVDAEDQRDRGRLLNAAADATHALFEIDEVVATRLLRPYLLDPNVDPDVAQAILLGLVRTQSEAAGRLMADVPMMKHPDAASLQVLLRAKHGMELDDRQQRLLRNIVRGGGAMQDTLRVQAAWALLKRMNRGEAAIAAVASR